jgi:hypothetical protein
LTLREAYQHLINVCAQSAIVTGVELLLLEEPVLKLRVHVGSVAFVDVFVNVETGKASFALIKDQQRIFGADNTRGWHLHPFASPESHHPCEEMSLENFLTQIEQNKDRLLQP